MALVFGTLTQLKTRLVVNSAQVSRTTWDDTITQIGSGVARAIEQFCNRKFERVENETDEFTADRMLWCLQRYPVESIASIAQRDGLQSGWVDQGSVNSFVQDWSPESGLVQFGSNLGSALSRVRVTYTGGYAIASMPEDVVEAWYLQCKDVFNLTDPLGQGIAAGALPERAIGGVLSDLKLSPQVKGMLMGHVRFQLT